MAITLTTTNACLFKAGKNVSPDMVSSALIFGSDTDTVINEWINQAEGEINMTTTHDWVTEYSSLGDIDKKMLDEIASSLVAINIIAYDMSGYTTRVEAESMISVHRDIALRGMKELKDKNTAEYAGAI